MPRKVARIERQEPYENYLHAELRHELSARHIRLPRRLTTRANFIKLLRDWDKKKKPPTAQAPRPTPTRRTFHSNVPMNATRVVRARRGCRFRLINVLLRPDFTGRWGAMAGKLEVNQLWLDVHAAFMAHNSMLDALHFHDALFVNVTPHVILPHSASRLLQMWVEIVAMYRNAVAQAKEAAAHNENAHSFFDFCAGRLDLLYLHMAMLLEPKLYKFILSDKIPVSDPFSKRKTTTPATTAHTATNAKPEAAIEALAHTTAKPVSGKGERNSVPTCTPTRAATTPPVIAATGCATPSGAVAAAVSAPTTTATHLQFSRVPTQNPEMKEIPTPADFKAPAVTTVLPKTATVKASKVDMKTKQTKPAASSCTSAVQAKSRQAVSKEKIPCDAGGAESANKVKRQVLPSKEKLTASQPKAKAASKSFHSKSSVGDKPVDGTMSSLGKRPHEDENTAIVEVPSVSDIVPHSGKRMHPTTTISTALAPRSTDMMLPPDEWDILESRLRKVNENIDRCHRGLASVEVTVSEKYKQSLEADLRFYSAIKQRLQEQLLVVMQSGY